MANVQISLERYEELIKKETIYDKIMEKRDVNLYLFEKVEEEINNGKQIKTQTEK